MAHRWDPVCPPADGLVQPVRRDPAGRIGPTRGQARGRGWRRTSPGLYLPHGVARDTPEQRILEVAARMPPHAAVTGWAALRLAGATFHDGLARDGRAWRPVPVAVGPRGGMRGPGVAVSFERLPEHEVVMLQGIRATHPVRATFDAVRAAADPSEAVVALEMALIAGLLRTSELAAFTQRRHRARRKPRVWIALEHARSHARSPAETRLRLRCEWEAGTSPLLVNRVLETTSGVRIGEIDLLDPDAGMGMEYDGEEHRDQRRHSDDVLKDEALRDHGVELLRVTARKADSPDLVRRVVAARRRALFLPAEERTWRVRPARPLPVLRRPWVA